jgi:tetratricopeptide (TPR) repeat protein
VLQNRRSPRSSLIAGFVRALDGLSMRVLLHVAAVLLVGLIAACATTPSEQAEHLYQRGLTRMNDGKLDPAIADFDAALALDPNHKRAKANRGYTWLLKKDADRALEDSEAVLRNDPDDSKSLVNRGVALMMKRQYDAALADFDRAVKAPQHDLRPLINRGLILYEKGEYDRAIADFDEVIRQNPYHPTVFKRRGNAWAYKGDYAKAIADFDRALSVFPEDIENWLYRCEARLRTGDYDRALADANEAIRRNAKDHRGFYMRGRTWHHKKEFEAALADFNSVAGLKPDDPGVRWARGETYFARMEYAQAVQEYEDAAARDPKLAAPFTVGLSNFFLGRFDKSAESLERAAATARRPYALLWLYLTNRRRGAGEEEASQLVSHQASDKRWPAALLDFYSGQITIEAVFSATVADAATAKDHICEAKFYVGMWHLIRRDIANARPLIEASSRECPSEFYEHHGALAELRRWPQR